MRMWKVDPKLMCDRHLLGEHCEMHMFAGCLIKGISIMGYVKGGLVEVDYLMQRHKELAEEMLCRMFNHKSPLIMPSLLSGAMGYVDVNANIRELRKRCVKCRKRRCEDVR